MDIDNIGIKAKRQYYQHQFTVVSDGTAVFFVALKQNLLFRGGRSPPSILKFKKFKNGGKSMKGYTRKEERTNTIRTAYMRKPCLERFR